MTKIFNPTQTLKCHLCGELYTEEKGHSFIVCEDTLLKRVAQLREQLATREKQREQASLARQQASNK